MQQLSLLHAPPSSWFTSCFYTVIYAVLLWLVFEIAKILWPGSPTDSKVGVPPGNRGLPFIGETLQLLSAISSSKGVYDFVRIRRLRYGICFKTNIFGVTNVFISSTESAKVILNNEMGRFTKRYIKSMAEVVGDQSVLCAAQQQHKLIRSSLSNLFSASSMSLFIKQFDKLIIDELGSWDHKGTVIVQDEAVKITLRAMCKMLMSLEGEDEVETLQKDVALVCKAMIAFPLRLPGTRFHRGLQARERIMCTLDKMISERRRGLEAHHEDFLQHLLKEGDEAPSLSDAQIKDNILTIIIAGQDTTASAISWMVKYLDENPEVLNTLEAEQLSLAEKSSPESFLTLDKLSEMPYASKVVKESLRMASIVPWFPRLVLQDCEIQGYKIKKGWSINVDARSIHHDPSLYSDPSKFIPSRFDDESKPYSFLAFGQGGRICLGMNMARAMLIVFLHRFVTTYKWKVVDSDSSVAKWAPFATLKSGCPIHVTRIS